MAVTNNSVDINRTPHPPSPTSRVLDVGCGLNKTAGSVGLDCRPYPDVDVIHDLERFPWPFESDAFDLAICSHIVEHMSDVGRFLKEIHRVCTNGACVRIDTPHFSSLDSWADPSHRQHLSLGSFEFFSAQGYLNDGSAFHIESATLTFRKALTSRLGAALFRLSPRLYEQNLCYLIPARDIKVVLTVQKNRCPTQVDDKSG